MVGLISIAMSTEPMDYASRRCGTMGGGGSCRGIANGPGMLRTEEEEARSVDPATNRYLDRRLIGLYSDVCRFLAENNLRCFVRLLFYHFFTDLYWVMASPNYSIWTR